MSVPEPTTHPALHGDSMGARLMRVLTAPAVDKTIAIVASLPFVYALYHRFTEGTLNVPRAGAAIGQLITIAISLQTPAALPIGTREA